METQGICSMLLSTLALVPHPLPVQACSTARYVPDKEWLAALIYADTGGYERLLPEVGFPGALQPGTTQIQQCNFQHHSVAAASESVSCRNLC
jgi:hypothetical protein